jgi:Mrp family chromosome partitioning ATPase
MSDREKQSEFGVMVERFIEGGGTRSTRELLTPIFVRRWLFVVCVAVPLLTAVGLSLAVPLTYTGTTKLLVRYETSEDAYLRDLIPENRPALSGMSSAELLRSLPTVLETVRQVDITDADIARKPMDVLKNAVNVILRHSDDSEKAGRQEKDAEQIRIAEAFQRSISDSTSESSTRPITILDKGVNSLPAEARGDDLITLNVPSFSRTKVASMANGLANAFIEEYAKMSAAEAERSVAFLDTLIREAEASPIDVRIPSPRVYSEQGENGAIYRRSPLLERLATDIADREANLAQISAMYSRDSPAAVNAQVAVDRLRASLSVLEREESQKLALEQLRVRRFQAANTERLFKEGLVPITIVEEAVTPPARSVATRVVLSGIAGSVLGLLLGLSAIVIATTLDQRIYTSWEAQRAVGLPLLSVIPELEQWAENRLYEEAFLQLWSRMDLIRRSDRGLSVAVTSATDGEGKSFIVAGLASILGGHLKSRALLIDADMKSNGLSIMTRTAGKTGLIDVLLQSKRAAECVQPTQWRGVDILPVGSIARRAELGFFRIAFSELVAELKKNYDYVLIDTSATLTSNDSIMSIGGVDGVIWVISAATTRRPLTQSALTKLADSGARPVGVLFNRRREYLPNIVWRNV